MNEFSSETGGEYDPLEASAPTSKEAPTESPIEAAAEAPPTIALAESMSVEPALSSDSAPTEKPSDAVVKDVVGKEAQGDILAKAASSEGLDGQRLTDATAEKVTDDLKAQAATRGDFGDIARAEIGEIRTNSLEAAQTDIATARFQAEGAEAARVKDGTAGSNGLNDLWHARGHESGPANSLESSSTPGAHHGGASESAGLDALWNPSDGAPNMAAATDMGHYRAERNDYSALRADSGRPETSLDAEAPPEGSSSADYREAATQVTARQVITSESHATEDGTGHEANVEGPDTSSAKGYSNDYLVRPVLVPTPGGTVLESGIQSKYRPLHETAVESEDGELEPRRPNH